MGITTAGLLGPGQWNSEDMKGYGHVEKGGYNDRALSSLYIPGGLIVSLYKDDGSGTTNGKLTLYGPSYVDLTDSQYLGWND